MCKKAVLLAVLATVGSAVLAEVASGQLPANLVVNPSFEEDEPIGGEYINWWTWGQDAGLNSTVAFDTTDFADGERSLRVVPKGSTNWWFILAYSTISVKTGEDCTVSLWAKADQPRVVGAQLKATDNTSGAWGYTDFQVTTEWAEYTFTTKPANGSLKLELMCAGSEVPFWLDFVWVYAGAYVPGVRPSGLSKGPAADPSPAAGATDVPRDAVLAWKAGEFAKTHDVYLGEAFDDVNNASRTDPRGVLASQGQDAATFDPAGVFAFGKTYTWRVDEVNAAPDGFIYKGDAWSFTVEPYGYPVTPVKATASSSMASTMGPEKTIDGSGLDAMGQHGTSASQMWLSKKGQSPVWIQYEFDSVYRLYQMWVWNSNQQIEQTVGFGAKDVKIETSTDGTTWTSLADVPQFSQASGEPNYVHNTTVDFRGAEAKYVKLTVSANWADGAKQAGLAEVRFSYVPVKAFGPSPASGSSSVALNATLNWRPGRWAAKHVVYVSADMEAVAKATAPAKTLTEHSLALASMDLQYGRTYYWRVDEVNDALTPGSWQGGIWSFSTIGYAVVDDFEAYNDTCNRVFFGWIDGFGHSGSADCGVAASSGNATGSTVGNVSAPFAERTITHGGRQSMPLAFDNTKSPFYSEAQREWISSQAWTGGGLDTLAVWLRGDAPAFLEASPGRILMNGTGTDIWGVSDQFRFAYKVLKGNGSILARVDSVANTDAWAKAGVMIRESVDSASTHAMTVMSPTSGASFQRRMATAGDSTSTDVTGLAAPYWVKVTRNGSTFTAQGSADGVTWSDMTATPAVTITMANDVLIGLAVTSHTATTVCGAAFSNVSTTGNVAGQWQVAEVGAPQAIGNSPETFYVSLQDAAGRAKTVTCTDPTMIATGAWQQWSIPFSQFSSAGVSLGAVKKMVIGVGDRGAPKAGSTGKLYIDDIRLTRQETP